MADMLLMWGPLAYFVIGFILTVPVVRAEVGRMHRDPKYYGSPSAVWFFTLTAWPVIALHIYRTANNDIHPKRVGLVKRLYTPKEVRKK